MDPIVVPGTLESLSPIRDYVKAAATVVGLDKKRIYRLQLAVDEIASNIVMHGYDESGTSGDIEVYSEVEDGRLTITLIDAAPPYDPMSQAPPEGLDSPLGERPMGGLGVFLTLQNVDTFDYRFANGRNHNIFIVNLDSTHQRTAPGGNHDDQ